MKKILIFASLFSILTACSTVTKHFSVVVDPPDAEIRVIAREGRRAKIYRSPAHITVSIPKDPAEAAKSRIEIGRDTYKTEIIGLLNVAEEQKLKIKLDNAALYRLKYRLIRPALSDDFTYRDRIVAVKIIPGVHGFDLKIRNLTQEPLQILWDRSEYTDYMNGRHDLMHTGIRPQDRADIVPPQTIPPAGTIEEAVFPKSSVSYSQVLRDYWTKLLLPVDSEAAPSLKGRTLNVFLPIEMDRAIIPDYNFKFQIIDVIKEKQ